MTAVPLSTFDRRMLSTTRITGLTLFAAFLALLFVPESLRTTILAVFDVLLVLTGLWVVFALVVLLRVGFYASKTILALLGLFVVSPIVLWIVGVRWDLFIRVGVTVTVDSHPVPGAQVYRGLNGGWLVIGRKGGMPSVYVPALHDVLTCDATLFHDYGVFGRLEKGRDEYFCISSAKQEITLDLQVGRNSLAFNRWTGRTVQRISVHQ